jgi:branched-chain amino acid transport system permease protein
MSPNDLTLPAPGRNLRLLFGIAMAAAACLAPLFLGNYGLHALIIALIFLLPAHGLNLLVGYTGLLSLAQAAFFGIGAYASGLMAVRSAPPSISISSRRGYWPAPSLCRSAFRHSDCARRRS